MKYIPLPVAMFFSLLALGLFELIGTLDIDYTFIFGVSISSFLFAISSSIEDIINDSDLFKIKIKYNVISFIKYLLNILTVFCIVGLPFFLNEISNIRQYSRALDSLTIISTALIFLSMGIKQSKDEIEKQRKTEMYLKENANLLLKDGDSFKEARKCIQRFKEEIDNKDRYIEDMHQKIEEQTKLLEQIQRKLH